MLSLIPGALTSFGWSDRVLALYNHVLDDQPAVAEATDLWPARVTRIERTGCFAVGPDGSERLLRGDPLPAVGEWILTDGQAVSTTLPRWSALTRVDPGGDAIQTLAANIDLVAVISPADRPSPARVEREVTLAWDSGAVPVVVVTKIDVDTADVAAQLAQRLVGVEVLAVSARAGVGIDDLRARLRPGRTVVLLGPSGAGKSTLANALLGADALATGAVREGDSRGRHTTTSRQLVAIPGGGVLIDTPGLRSLGLPPDADVNAGFRDVQALAAECRFSDCLHEGEPGCAVTAAVRAGSLNPDRLDSFRKLAHEIAYEERRGDRLKQQAERQVWKARTKQQRVRRREDGRD